MKVGSCSLMSKCVDVAISLFASKLICDCVKIICALPALAVKIHKILSGSEPCHMVKY
jgi:hypothetical protein